MKTIKNITDKKVFWVGVLTIIFVVWCMAVAHADSRFRGYIEQSYFPLNDEHGIYAETKINVEKPITKLYGKEIFGFAVPTISWAKKVEDRTRNDNTYLTSYSTKFAYISTFDLGLGVKLNDRWEAKLIYRAHRMPDGYEGDWTGVSVKYTFGAK